LPTLSEAADLLGIREEAIDKKFGIVAIDPDEGLYTVRLNEAEAKKLNADAGDSGPYSDPKIAPMVWRRGP
jgi:hypothetical protein